ncbi:hypothetical protein [Pseudostreptobacillus hongkongensis]|uniref:hypothetical protein n=1 Tax=Pseudostreptobacillus hongkongensis TaxID=1162717 RepID=UPI0028D41203|nr:hypothetical protein [Pseudostreptobacillus hongkongensis]
MKKIIITLGVLVAGFSFAAEPKYNLANIENNIATSYINQISFEGTKQFVLDQFNQKVYAQMEANKNLKSDKDAKLLTVNAIKSLLEDWGYVSNLEFRDKDITKLEIALYTDKTLTQKDLAYLADLLEKASYIIYGDKVSGNVKIYADKELKTLKK